MKYLAKDDSFSGGGEKSSSLSSVAMGATLKSFINLLSQTFIFFPNTAEIIQISEWANCQVGVFNQMAR